MSSCTVCDKVAEIRPWEPGEKALLRRFVCHGMKEWPTLIICYHEAQGTLTQTASGHSWEKTLEVDLKVLDLFKSEATEDALLLMADTLLEGIQRHWPDCPLPSYHALVKQRLERPKGSSTLAEHPATEP